MGNLRKGWEIKGRTRNPRKSWLIFLVFLIAERAVELVEVLVERGRSQLLLAVTALQTGQMEWCSVCSHVGLSGEHGLL